MRTGVGTEINSRKEATRVKREKKKGGGRNRRSCGGQPLVRVGPNEASSSKGRGKGKKSEYGVNHPERRALLCKSDGAGRKTKKSRKIQPVFRHSRGERCLGRKDVTKTAKN